MAFGGRNPLHIMMVKDDYDTIRAILPLGRKENFPPRYELLGSSILREPGGLLYSDQTVLRAVIHRLLDINQPITLRRLLISDPVAEVLDEELNNRSYRKNLFTERIPFVSIQTTWEQFEQEHLSSSRRSSFRRLKRKAEKHGPVRMVMVQPKPEEVDTYLDQIYRIEAANWKGRAGTAIQTHPTLAVFFRVLAQQMAQRNHLRFYFLKVGDQTVAAQFSLIYKQRLWIFKIGYDEEWAWCSPGILLMHEVVKFSFNESLQAVEFLGNDAAWLHIWATDWHQLVNYELYPRNVIGTLARPRDLLQKKYHQIDARFRRRRAMNSSP
jgi:CelD/BcsL family acetyltransferase involved in cellulose biosynthesis